MPPLQAPLAGMRASGSVRSISQRLFPRLRMLDVVRHAAIPHDQLRNFRGPELAVRPPVNPNHLCDIALDVGHQIGDAAGDLSFLKLRSWEFTARNFLPSMATQAPFSRKLRRHSCTDRARVRRMPGLVSRRKSAIP
ncbi:hypothetical protein [Gemmobacter sp. 24YEA27]|uniref:hypothetical protein n=1 Tax=Gemmobacter sp. 24YEA27 TaxID=3040672 RepID=UPI0024B38F8E|nr:hypothetical protein [Gemmobacter sp. 24YEA27]